MIALAVALSILLIVFLGILIYSFVVGVIFGAPYLPTLQTQRRIALEMLDLKPGQTLYDLGCGDGRMLKSAAKAGLNAVGYELSPILYIIARLVNWRYRKQVKVILGNYWQADWHPADGIFVFLMDRYMGRFEKKVKALGKPIKVASYTFRVPGKKPAEEREAVFLYLY